MKVLIKFAIWLVVCLLISCAIPATYIQRERAAKQAVEDTLNDLPEIEGFAVIKVLEVDLDPVFDTEISQPCFYGRVYELLGSAFSQEDALDIYSEHLQGMNWQPDGKQFDITQKLIRGKNERIVVETGELVEGIGMDVDFTKLNEAYKSLILIRVDYMIPYRDGC